MGMSTFVYGFKPPDEKWARMKQIYEACEKEDIEIPDKVDDYFNGNEPDPAGVRVDIPAEGWRDENSEGIEIEVEKIPKDVKIIRFVNSW